MWTITGNSVPKRKNFLSEKQVNFARDRLIITSYSADAILAKAGTWSDGLSALA